MGLEGIGKLLIGGAVVLLVLGGIFLLLGRFGLDRLPGDLVFRRGNLTVYAPIGLMILVSVVGTILLNIFLRSLNADGGYGDEIWEVLFRPSRRLRGGMVLSAGGDKLRIVKALEEGRWGVAGENVRGILRRRGRAPLPPYIKATPEAEREYQTVYARDEGSAAAPTAGFHFTEGVLGAVEATGAGISRVTLHVGVGTFSPVRTEKLEDHRMHAERYRVPEETARVVKDASRVVAVGTTVARTLESCAAMGTLEGESELFIYPGYRWRQVDALLTNFHLPRSTLLAMVMAFAGKELVREAYEVAVRERYRFFSFGDAMFLLNGGKTR